MFGAKDGGLGKQQQVATGKINRFVRCARVRNMSTGGAPVFAVKIANGKIKNGQRLNCSREASSRQAQRTANKARGYNTKIPAEMTQFRFFPNETVTDENWIELAGLARQRGKHRSEE